MIPTAFRWCFVAVTLGFGGGRLVAAAAAAADSAPRWSAVYLKQSSEWYGTKEARTLANILLSYQSPQGAWPKNTDLFKPLSAEEIAAVHAGSEANTIDNDGTTLPLRFVALICQASPDEKYRRAFGRGIDYLLSAQYSNGGWPQFYPLRPGYYSHITYNDGAMVHVLELLREIGRGRKPYDFVDDARRMKVKAAIARGIDCILKTQVRQDGKPTVWCAQHDETTFAPAWARKFEPPSLSGSESVGIVRFLMSVENPSPEIVASVEGAVAWFRATALTGVRVEAFPGSGRKPDRRLIHDPSAPKLWARFYELGTNRPIYVDRDSVVHYEFAEIGYERRSGYLYHGDWPASLLDTDFPRWHAQVVYAAAGK